MKYFSRITLTECVFILIFFFIFINNLICYNLFYFIIIILFIFLYLYLNLLFENMFFLKNYNPILNSKFIKFHIIFIILSYSSFIYSLIISLTYIFFILIFKKIFIIKILNYYIFFFSFINFSIGNIIGSFWAKISWGNFWNWDIKEVWSLILWFNSLILIHLNFLINNILINFLNLFNFIIILILFFFINFLYKNSFHIYL
ncbi:hypothetical protein CU086_00095 [Candidatus Nasuia deltocephalinicola]|uniref:Cytochrome c assembly protein domain-containing protein n=1 Tax=Candidatus Nasuia deltocephalincola TaxID=1160784 RepID=A0A974WKB3_9PROT|nr:hypothetical protein CU086_00095 [Candidatus Nasuia deltocephalinicola]